jgi:hypothetical protein
VARRQRPRARAKRVRRPDIPPGEGTRRPCGLPAVDDPRRQRAVTRRRQARAEQAGWRGRKGYRPHGGALAAVDRRTLQRHCGRSHVGIEADLTGGFDTSAPGWWRRRVAARRADGAWRRLLGTGRTRRRPRRSDTWCGVRDLWPPGRVARPRIVGRPPTRWARGRAEAGRRRRVVLKSPGREHCTPGAARGQSGHWPSYRNDFTTFKIDQGVRMSAARI